MKKLKRISTITLKPGRLNNLKEFDWKAFCNKNNRIAVHCKTEEEAQDFCDQMDKHGLRWSTSDSYLKYNYYKAYGPKTCYSNQGEFCSLDYFENNNYRIFEWSDYMIKSPKNILELGYVVELRNKRWYIFLPCEKGCAFVKSCYDPIDFKCYDYELNCKENDCLDVMKIYGYANNPIDILYISPEGRSLLWERKERPEIKMTVDEMKQRLEEILNAKIVEE